MTAQTPEWMAAEITLHLTEAANATFMEAKDPKNIAVDPKFMQEWLTEYFTEQSTTSTQDTNATLNSMILGLHAMLFGESSQQDPEHALASISDRGEIHEFVHEMVRLLPHTQEPDLKAYLRDRPAVGAARQLIIGVAQEIDDAASFFMSGLDPKEHNYRGERLAKDMKLIVSDAIAELTQDNATMREDFAATAVRLEEAKTAHKLEVAAATRAATEKERNRVLDEAIYLAEYVMDSYIIPKLEGLRAATEAGDE